jgi:glycosyltransferase involved in cell wall biosynthesis
MAAGLPVVAPNAGGVTSYATQSNAWLTDSEPESFAEAIRSVGADPASCARKTAEARRTAEEHRWSNVTARYLQLYRELHAVTQGHGAPETIAARTWSTRGDSFGREVPEM